MKIGGLQKVSLLDFPDKIAAIVFCQGCNLRCPFCFNRDLVLGNRPIIASKTVLTFLRRRRHLLEGVVLTGGEPLLQPDLEVFIRQIRRLGLAVKLDTNGFLPQTLAKLLKDHLLDYVALDIKAPFDQTYVQATGSTPNDCQLVIKSFQLLKHARLAFELRTTVVPGLHSAKKLRLMAKQLRQLAGRKNIPWFWQNFQPQNCLDPKYNRKQPYSPATFKRFFTSVRPIYPAVWLRFD